MTRKKKNNFIEYGLQNGQSSVALNLKNVILNNVLKYFFIESFQDVKLINTKLVPNNAVSFPALKNSYIKFFYDSEKVKDKILIANFQSSTTTEKFNIRLFPNQNLTTLHLGSFKKENDFLQTDTSIVFLENAKIIKAIILENDNIQFTKTDNPENLMPLVADMGSVIYWNKELWRTNDFELFSWELLENVLVFDFLDYAIQDLYLKRLAFFVEKVGYSGKLHEDEKIKHLHGFNAHDYKAESLADFFNLANQTNFSLNEKEKILCKILENNKIIKRIVLENGNEKFVPLNGAIISISQQSNGALRHLLLAHECFHGIYFTDEKFRNYVQTVFEKVDSTEWAFMKSYFVNTPNLSYNPKDDYLLKNEFMAYLLQQSTKACSSYFADNLANRKFVNAATPELCKKIKETRAQSLTDAAIALDNYVYENYALNAGRVFLISRSSN
ncbi:MAG: hypothetical protein GX220_07430 [Treponema sp.]|nr:hypothetical protein [Treponema sp.]